MEGKIDKDKNGIDFNWSILLIISFSSIILGIYRDGIAAIFPFLQRDFSLTRTQIGLYMTSLYLVSSIISLFSGYLVDVKGTKWSIAYGILFTGILLLLHSLVPNYISLLFLAALGGFGLSINSPAANRGIKEYFPIRWRSTATGIWSSSFPVGGLLSASFLPLLGVAFGWRIALLFPSIMAILCSFVILKFYGKNEKCISTSKISNISFGANFSQLFRNINLLGLSIYGFFLGCVESSIISHFTLFLYLDGGLSEKISGMGFAVVQLGSIIGRPLWGLFCDRFLRSNRRKGFLFIGVLFMVIALFFSISIKVLNLYIIFVFAFLAGFIGQGWNGLFFSSITDVVNEKQTGSAIGLSMLFLRIGMLITPPVFGFIADIRNSYDLSWLLLGLIMLVASVGQFLFFKKRR
jgi:MFS family permease